MGTSRTAIDRAIGMAFAKAAPKSGLEYDRRNLQEEISKLTMIISDEAIPLSTEEIMDINEQINTLMHDKFQVEISLRSESGVNLVHPISRRTLYFGRAKQIQANIELEGIKSDLAEKRKIFQTTDVKVVPQEVIVKKLISKQVVPKKKIKAIEE